MSDSLFNPKDIPETPSPRVRWMRRHNVVTQKTDVTDAPFVASIPGRTGFAIAMTEDDAIVELAKLHNLKLWNEE